MKTVALSLVLLLASMAAFAQAQVAQDPQAAQTTAQSAPAAGILPADENSELINADLHALSRITTLAQNLGDARQVLLAITDSDIRTLRGPRDDGSYKWASLQREEGGRVTDEKTIEQVSTEKELRNVTVAGDNGYRVEVSVPSKRGVFAGNNRVWIRNVLVDSTGFDGKVTHSEIPVNAWVNPGDSNGLALPQIGRSVKATVELGVETGSKKAVATVAVVQAKLVDDPSSPYFPAVKRLLQIRDFAAAKDIDRGHLKNAIDEAILTVPGEVEKRTAELARITEERKQLALTGQPKGAIALGDATPDVVKEITDISRLLTGTLDDQTAGRTRLQTLIDTLSPKMQTETQAPPQ